MRLELYTLCVYSAVIDGTKKSMYIECILTVGCHGFLIYPFNNLNVPTIKSLIFVFYIEEK